MPIRCKHAKNTNRERVTHYAKSEVLNDGDHEEQRLLDCDVVYFGRKILMFTKDLPPQYSLIYSEDEGRKFIRNVDAYLQNY
jgi:hypothetical protein